MRTVLLMNFHMTNTEEFIIMIVASVSRAFDTFKIPHTWELLGTWSYLRQLKFVGSKPLSSDKFQDITRMGTRSGYCHMFKCHSHQNFKILLTGELLEKTILILNLTPVSMDLIVLSTCTAEWFLLAGSCFPRSQLISLTCTLHTQIKNRDCYISQIEKNYRA